MRRIRLATAAVIASLVAAALSGCDSSADNAGAGTFDSATPDTLSVVTATIPTPGLWEGTATRPTGGFEYALAQQLAARLGLSTVRVTTQPFQTIVGGDLGGADMALSLLTPTDERDKVLDFSAPYMNTPPAVLAREEIEVPDLKAARALRWVVVRDSTLEAILDETIQPTSPVLRVRARPDVIEALVGGAADAALFDLPLAASYASRSNGGLHVPAKLEKPERIAAALPAGSSNGEAVSSAIRALIADGTVDRLAERWLGPAAAGGGDDVPILRSSR